MADPAFYEDAERSTEAIAEHALLKKRLAEHEEEWIVLSEEVEEAMREPRRKPAFSICDAALFVCPVPTRKKRVICR